MRRTVLALAFAASLLPLAHAQASSFSTLEERMSAADFRRAGLEKLSEEELAALNAWLQREGTGHASRPSGSEDRRGMRATPLDEEADVVSRLPGPFTGWEGGTLFRLENGQVWRSVDSGSSLRGVNAQDPRVTIRKGLIGGWRLKVEGYNASVRVERVE